VVSSKAKTQKEDTRMKIPLELEITFQDGVLILTTPNGQMILPPDHQVQRKIQMVTLGKLGPLTVEELCNLFHYKTRKSYYDIRRLVLENKIEKLLPQRTGPKTSPKRTPQLEKRVIQLRLTTNKDMYALTRTLNAEGFSIKPRLVAQILADYGISKKKHPRGRSKNGPFAS